MLYLLYFHEPRKEHDSRHEPQLTMVMIFKGWKCHCSHSGRQRRSISDVLCVLFVARSEGYDQIIAECERASLSVSLANVVSRPMYFCVLWVARSEGSQSVWNSIVTFLGSGDIMHQCPALDLAASCHRTLMTFLTLGERFVAAYGQLSQFRPGSFRGFDCFWMPEMDSQWFRSRIVPKLARTTQVVVYIKGTKWVCIAVPRIPG